LAADQHVADAQLHYGICLEEGQGVSQDLIGAAKYFKLAAVKYFSLPDFNPVTFIREAENLARLNHPSVRRIVRWAGAAGLH
jgi:hypothetical protein